MSTPTMQDVADLKRENEELRREIKDLNARVEELEIEDGFEDERQNRRRATGGPR